MKAKGKQDQNTIKISNYKNKGTHHKDKGQTRAEHNKNGRQYKLGNKP